MNESELISWLDDLKKDRIKINAQVAIGTQLKSPGQVRKIRKDIARVKTELKKKEEEKQE